MASVHREIAIARSADEVWDALADVGALHTRLVPGFVVDTKLKPGDKVGPWVVVESLGNGGTLAKYAAEGVETYLVTATRGAGGTCAS